MAKQDFYSVLGVPQSATADEIKSAYRKMARKFHPDATKNDPTSTEMFKEVQDAYDVLGDATERKNYDRFSHAGVGAQPAAGRGRGADKFEPSRRAQQARSTGAQQAGGRPAFQRSQKSLLARIIGCTLTGALIGLGTALSDPDKRRQIWPVVAFAGILGWLGGLFASIGDWFSRSVSSNKDKPSRVVFWGATMVVAVIAVILAFFIDVDFFW